MSDPTSVSSPLAPRASPTARTGPNIKEPTSTRYLRFLYLTLCDVGSLQKPYACQVVGCTKKYTDPSSLRKHVKNHSNEEQMLIKKKSHDEGLSSAYVRKFFDPNRQKAVKSEKREFYGNVEHNYSNYGEERKYDSSGIRQDLKNKISEKNRLRSTY